MRSIDAFTRKADYYARYRWDYAKAAIEQIFEITGVGMGSVIADIGAGPGILTRHFIGRMQRIFAVEPNEAMRYEAEKRLSACPECAIHGTPAEKTGLPGESIDLITVGQAAHWFQAEAARSEFRRILRPGGWLALLRNTSAEDPVLADLRSINTPAYGVMVEHPAPSAKISEQYYFEGGHYQTFIYPIRIEQNLDRFIGSVLSASFTPDERNPAYERFVQALHEIFHRRCPDGIRVVEGQTHLMLGQPFCNS